jgi:hypothetical protein
MLGTPFWCPKKEMADDEKKVITFLSIASHHALNL